MEDIRILIIEDDHNIANLIRRVILHLLPESKFFFANDGSEAMEFLEKQDFSLITLDGNLGPGEHGRELLMKMTPEQIKKIVVCSGELDFIKECNLKGIEAICKADDFFEEFARIFSLRGIS